MNKARFALTTLAALTAAPLALAQGLPDPQAQDGPAAPAPAPAGPVGATTVTSAEPPAAPAAEAPQVAPAAPLAPPRPRETILARASIRPNRPLLITGASTLVGGYVTTAAVTAVAARQGRNADPMLYMPVVGPWAHLADVTEGTLDMILIAGSGVVQGAGLGLTVLSLLLPEKIPAATIEALGTKVTLTAASQGPGAAGLGAVGEF